MPMPQQQNNRPAPPPPSAAAADDGDWVDVPPAGTAKQVTGTQGKVLTGTQAEGNDSDWVDVQPDGTKPNVRGTSTGPMARYQRSFRSAMGFTPEYTSLKDDMGQVVNAVSHPLDTLRSMGDAQQAVIDKAYNEQHDSSSLIDKVRGYVRGAESAIPGVGPLLSKAGDESMEHNYAGALGTMTPLMAPEAKSAKLRLGEAMRDETGALRPGLQTAAKGVGTVGGYMAGASVGHPYMGGGVGAAVVPKLVDLVVPGRDAVARTNFRGGAYLEPGGAESGEGRVTRLPIRNTPFSNPLTPEQIPGPDAPGGNDRLTGIAKSGDVRAGSELQRRGSKILYVPDEDTPSRGDSLINQIRRQGGDISKDPSTGVPVQKSRVNDGPLQGPDQRTGADRRQVVADSPAYQNIERRQGPRRYGVEDMNELMDRVLPEQAKKTTRVFDNVRNRRQDIIGEKGKEQK
jgi:hypothetical protein